MNYLISGGSKNGKTGLAQRIAVAEAKKAGVSLYYVATMVARDPEDEKRILLHKEDRRGLGFLTIECPRGICGILDAGKADPAGVFLVDSVTALMAEEMFFPEGGGEEAGGKFSHDALAGRGEKVRRDLEEFAVRTGKTIFISDSIYSDAAVYDDMTEIYRSMLAGCDKALARICENVIEVCFGNPITHKGKSI